MIYFANMDRIEKIKSFLEQNPKDAFLIHALALEYLKLEDAEQALACFKHNQELNPDYVGTYYHLGKLLEQLGNEQEAALIYEQGMQEARNQKDQHAYNELQSALDNLL